MRLVATKVSGATLALGLLALVSPYAFTFLVVFNLVFSPALIYLMYKVRPPLLQTKNAFVNVLYYAAATLVYLFFVAAVALMALLIAGGVLDLLEVGKSNRRRSF